MEMESSRRPVDKTRELGLKRPRLAEEPERNRSGRGDGAFVPRFRVSERDRGGGKGRAVIDDEKERDDSARGAYHQQQELLSQYKTALGELTFNSKPIITNLTIIAGENTHAAKGIAATICANVLEVPREQKLPSLYLLDSIVKNIGGEYVKYFAVRLPEVFCKAYRQVDTTLHPSMQHLFKTWKGVFPLPPLRAIEQELDFSPVNGSSSGVSASRSDSQSQRPGHGIHVNPKYLEARQRLQSGRSRGIDTENNGNLLLEEAERPERTSLSEIPKPWAEAPAKTANMPHPQSGERLVQSGERLVESLYSNKPVSGYGDYEFGSNSASRQGMGITRPSERDTLEDGGDRAWYGGIGNTETGLTFGKRNGYDMPNLQPRAGVSSYKNYRGSKSAETLPQLNSASTVSSFNAIDISRNWKNSEEEEFMWDVMNSRTTDMGVSEELRKGGWNGNSSEKPASVQMQKWIQTGSEDLDSNWSRVGNLSQSSRPVEADDDRFASQMHLDEQVQQSYSQKDGGYRDNREASVESSSVVQGEAAFVHRTGKVPLEKLNQTHTTSRLLNIDTLNYSGTASSDVGQPEGCTVALGGTLHPNVTVPSIGRTGVGVQVGPVGPSSFIGPFDGIPGHRHQQPRRPASPKQHRPHSPSSVSHQVPIEQQQPYSLPEDIRPQAISILTGQKSSNVVSQSTPPQVQGVKELPYQSQRMAQANSSGCSQLHQQLKPLQHFRGASSPAQQGMHLSVQSEPSQTPEQSWQPQAQPQGFGLQATGYSSSGLLKKSSGGLPAESSADNLLAAILKSGLLPAQTAASTDVPKSTSGISSMNSAEIEESRLKLNVQPPLPNGPPPVQFSASSHSASLSTSVIGSGPEGALLAVSLPLSETSRPPLPPGPPPVSSIVGTSSQGSSSSKVAKNPLASLLSSLVAKGLISTSVPELPKATPVQVPNQTEEQSDGCAATSNLVSAVSPLTPDGELSVSESSSMPSGRSNASTEFKDGLGVEFNPGIIRKFHLSVVNSLFDDLPHQCSMCGLRFKFEDNLTLHLNWHSSSKLQLYQGKRISRKWYLSWRDWIEGAPGPSSVPIHSPEREVVLSDEKTEPMVPADESQTICISCGEPFEDFYCYKKDEWMFKGARYITVPTGGSALKNLQKLIVHANCISESTMNSLNGPQTSLMDQTIR